MNSQTGTTHGDNSPLTQNITIESLSKRASFGHALYYPYIHLTNKNWLKHAFLFWNKISRIVPHSFEPQDNEDVIRIRQETNFLEDYKPDQWIIQDTFRDFAKYLTENNDMMRYLRHHHERERDRHHFDIEYREMFESMRHRTISNSSYIHIDKIDPHLTRMLIDMGLALRGEHEWSSWIKIDNEIGSLYMTYLAKSIAQEKSIPIVTDSINNLTTTINGRRGYRNDFSEQLGYLIIDSVVPKDINSVTMEQLIKIRNKYDDQRVLFFDEINKLSATLPTIDNKSALKDALNYHNGILLKQTKELEKVFELNGIESIIKPIASSMVVGMATDYIIPSEWKLLGLSTGLLYGTVSAYTNLRRRRIENEKNPMSYILNIQSELDKKSLFEKIKSSVR